MDINTLQNRIDQAFRVKATDADGHQLPSQATDEIIVEGGSLDSKELLDLLKAEYDEYKVIADNMTDQYSRYSPEALKEADKCLNPMIINNTQEKEKYEYCRFRLRQMLDSRLGNDIGFSDL